jgi:hypothetical protein
MQFNEGYRTVTVWVAVVYVVGLVLSPEEEKAMTGGVHRHPETESYDVIETIIEKEQETT